MTLAPLILSMRELLAQTPPAGATLAEKRALRLGNSAKAKLLAASVPRAEREALCAQVTAWMRATNAAEPERLLLCEVQNTLEMDLDDLGDMVRTAPVVTERRFEFDMWDGFSAAPTAFVRSALFASIEPGTQLFQVLGMKHVAVERGKLPLTDTHLQVMLYLVSKVRAWDAKLGASITFKAREATDALGWQRNKQSLVRLRDAIERLAQTTVRVLLDEQTEREEAAPMIARRVTDMDVDARHAWEVQLTATLLNTLNEFHTFLKFETLAALPTGCATWLYAFISSEASRESEWDLETLAQMSGLTSKNPYEIKRKLTAALDTLVRGSVEVKARGKAVQAEGRSELVDTQRGLAVRSLVSTTRTFDPPLAAYSFRKTAAGKTRVKLVKR